MKDRKPELPRYEITHGASTTEAIVVQDDNKTIIQPVTSLTVADGESFTITVRDDDEEDLTSTTGATGASVLGTPAPPPSMPYGRAARM